MYDESHTHENNIVARLKVREHVERLGLDAAKLSRRADIAYGSAHSAIYDPDYKPSLKILEKIASALGVAVTDIIENGPAQEEPHE